MELMFPFFGLGVGLGLKFNPDDDFDVENLRCSWIPNGEVKCLRKMKPGSSPKYSEV